MMERRASKHAGWVRLPSSRLEKIPQNFARFHGVSRTTDFGAMMAGGLLEKFGSVEDGAALGIFCCKHHLGDAGHGDSTGAHRAGLQRDIKPCPRQPLIANFDGGGADDLHLGMSGGVFARDNPVTIAGEDIALSRE